MKTNVAKLASWAITVALGGFLFGFDTAVISGAEQAIQTEWQLSDTAVGQLVAMALYGTILGALIGGVPAERWGRKRTLQLIGVLYLLSAAASALAPDAVTLMIARFVGGVGVGASSVVAPMYITEVSPPNLRGRLVATFQLNIVAGILVAYLSNYLIAGGAWRFMLGIEVVPAILFVLLLLRVPRSPRWLAQRARRPDEALSVLRDIDPSTAEAELAAIVNASDSGAEQTSVTQLLSSGRYTRPVMLAFLFAFFNQLSGINAIIYYAPRIFSMTGLGEDASLLASAGVGLFNFAFTLLGMLLIDRLGRRTLMLIGSLGLIVALAGTAYAFASENFAPVPYLIFGYISFFAMSQGAVIWVFISEIFPTRLRAFGNTLGSSTHWVFAAGVAAVFPALASQFGGATVFGFFTAMMVLQLLYVAFLMPETKGRRLEEIAASTAHG